MRTLLLEEREPSVSVEVEIGNENSSDVASRNGLVQSTRALVLAAIFRRRKACTMSGFGDDNPKDMPSHLFFGATHLDFKRAIKADITQQNFSVCPRHWYVDAHIPCVDCGDHFVFSREEQRHWYEKRKFWIDSFPDRCKSCQAAQKEMHQQLDYIRNHHRHTEKADKVKAMTDEVVARYGFLPKPLKDMNVA